MNKDELVDLIQWKLKEGLMGKVHATTALRFLSIDTPSDLLREFYLLRKDMEKLINYPSYRHFMIPKKKKGLREIDVPEPNLLRLQRKLNRQLQCLYLFAGVEYAKGCVIQSKDQKGIPNIVSNAAAHVGKRYVLSMDIRDFFVSVRAPMVKRAFMEELGMNEHIATVLTLLSTFDGRLPQGSPSSPIISNFVFIQADLEFARYCQKHGVTYTRYVDDLTFSSNEQFTKEMIEDLIKIVEGNGFKVNEQKFRMKTNARRQAVTGLTVNQKVNVDRKYIKRIRAMIHDLKVNGLPEATKKHFGFTADAPYAFKLRFQNRLRGYIDFVGQVRGREDVVYLKLKNEFLLIK